MTFDLGDATKWEFFFPNVEQPLLVVPEDSSATLEGTEAKVRDHQPQVAQLHACMHCSKMPRKTLNCLHPGFCP